MSRYGLTHGENRRGKRTPEYISWTNLVQRCTNPKNVSFNNYGGRGITVCERWLKFENFLADMGRRPSAKHSLDRYPDNDGNYEPSNCRWATAKQQAHNSRNYHRPPKERCVNGHRLTADNVFIYKNKDGHTLRSCRMCRRAASKRYEEKYFRPREGLRPA